MLFLYIYYVNYNNCYYYYKYYLHVNRFIIILPDGGSDVVYCTLFSVIIPIPTLFTFFFFSFFFYNLLSEQLWDIHLLLTGFIHCPFSHLSMHTYIYVAISNCFFFNFPITLKKSNVRWCMHICSLPV